MAYLEHNESLAKPIEQKLHTVSTLWTWFWSLDIVGVLITWFATDGVTRPTRYSGTERLIGADVGMILGLAVIWATIVFVGRIVLHALAELIRIQKRKAGMKYEGDITGQETWTCAICDHVFLSDVSQDNSACPSCGSEFK